MSAGGTPRRATVGGARAGPASDVMAGASRFLSIGREVAREFKEDDLSGLAGELSYRFFLALFPLFIFLAALGGFVAEAVSAGDPSARLMDEIGSALPADARSVLERELRDVLDSRSGSLLSFGVIGAVWASSAAVKSLMKALNRVYDVPETRPFWKSTGLAIALTITGSACALGAVALLAATQAFGHEIAAAVGAGTTFEWAVAMVRWPIVILLVVIGVELIYWLGPDTDARFRPVSPGAVAFALVWLAAAIGFGLYVANFGSYNKTYGALGGVMVWLTWLYLSNLMLLLGAEIDATLAEHKSPSRAAATRASTRTALHRSRAQSR